MTRISATQIIAVVFAFIILASFTSFKEGEIPLTFILVTVVFIGQQIYEAVAVANNVSNISHIIGGMIARNDHERCQMNMVWVKFL